MKLIADFILVSGLIANLIILILLLRKRPKELSDKLLLVLFTSLFLVSVNFYAYLHKITVVYVLTFPLEDSIGYLLGPTFLLYVRSLFYHPKGLVRRHLLHYLPLAINLLIIDAQLVFYGITETDLPHYLQVIMDTEWVFIFRMLYLLFYVWLSIRILNEYQEAIKGYFADLSEVNFEWLRAFLFGTIVVISIDLATSCFEMIFGERSWDTGYLTVFGMIILIGYLGYHGITQANILLPDFLWVRQQELAEIPLEQEAQTLRQAQRGPQVQGTLKSMEASLPTPPLPDAEELADRLAMILVNDEAYLDEELTLGKLAALLPCPDKKLSQLLNQHLDTSFYDIVNHHRIEAVKAMMSEDTYGRKPIIEIAYACGFKSKTSFNRVFKKMTGRTPGEWRAKV